MRNEKHLRWYVLGKDKKLTEVTKQNEERYFNIKKYRLNKEDVDLTKDYVLIAQYRATGVEYVPVREQEKYFQLIRYYNVRRRAKGFVELSPNNSHIWMPKLQAMLIESYPHADLNTALNVVLTSGRINNSILMELTHGNTAPLIAALNATHTNKLTDRYDSKSKSLNDVLRSNFEISIVESDFYAEYYDLSNLESPSSDVEEYDFIYAFKGVTKDT